MTTDLHPDVEPAVTALAELLIECPSVHEFADVLESLHNLTGGCLLTALGDALDQLARQADDLTDLTEVQRTLISEHLTDASSRLGFVGEYIDKARAATGEWTR